MDGQHANSEELATCCAKVILVYSCSLRTETLATEMASFSAYGSRPEFHYTESYINGGIVGLPIITSHSCLLESLKQNY